jgi:hypothetical protein
LDTFCPHLLAARRTGLSLTRCARARIERLMGCGSSTANVGRVCNTVQVKDNAAAAGWKSTRWVPAGGAPRPSKSCDERRVGSWGPSVHVRPQIRLCSPPACSPKMSHFVSLSLSRNRIKPRNEACLRQPILSSPLPRTTPRPRKVRRQTEPARTTLRRPTTTLLLRPLLLLLRTNRRHLQPKKSL